MQSIGLLLIRVMVGWVMFFHGAQKVFGVFVGEGGGGGMEGFVAGVAQMGLPGPPAVMAWAAALSELVGGLLLILGLVTRVACVFVATTMYVAAFAVHGKAFALQAQGMEYALTLAVAATGVFLTGPGTLSVDAFIWRKKEKED